MPTHRTMTAALLGAVVALSAVQVLDAVAPPAPTMAAAAASRPAPPPFEEVRRAATPAPEPQIVVVPAPGASEVDLEPLLQRLDVLAVEIAQVRAEAANRPDTAPPMIEVVEVPVAAPSHQPEEHAVSYEWTCGEDCTYVTTVYHTEGNEAGGDAGDIDAVTYVCVPSDAAAVEVDGSEDLGDVVGEDPPPAQTASTGDSQTADGSTASTDGGTSSGSTGGSQSGGQSVAECGDVSN